MMFLLLNAALAGSTAMSRMAPEAMHFNNCDQLAQAEENLDRVVAIWAACETEAKRLGYTGLLPTMEGRRVLAEVQRDNAGADPVAMAQAALRVVAAHPQASFEMAPVRAYWLTLLQDPASRQNLGKVRTVDLRWEPDPGRDAALTQQVDAQLRRFIADMGFRVEPANTGDAARADIRLTVDAKLSRPEPQKEEEKGKIQVVDVRVETDELRLVAMGVETAGFSLNAVADHPDALIAQKSALEAAAKGFAEQLLLRVVQQVFRSTE